jgi:hypothetical protein
VRALAADALLVLHALLVAFNVGGLVGTWLGAAMGWAWVRSRPFRFLHLASIGVVAVGALAGAACPLTVWEDALRGGTPAASFVGRWVAWILYWDPPPWMLTAVYVAWAAATAVTLVLIPPRARPKPTRDPALS